MAMIKKQEEKEKDEIEIPEQGKDPKNLESTEAFKDGLQSLQDDLRKSQDEAENLKDQCLRAYAETENIRRRSEKEIQETRRFAVSGIIEDLINVIESLYRSTEHINEEDKQQEQVRKIVEGIELTRKELLAVLSKNNVQRIEPKPGNAFDHNLHQALSQTPDNNHPKNTIIKVIQAGYLIEDRLIKPALVIVSSGEAE